MNSPSSERGFTIVETLIVLAVTGALFLSAVILVAGRQRQVEFSQAANDIQSVIQETISQVGTGYYANTGNFTCNGTSGTVSVSPGSASQGTNTGCIFLGKAMQFAVKSTDPQQYRTYTLAGVQDNTGSLASAKPIAIAPGLATNSTPSYPDASTRGELRSGLTVKWMRYTSGAATTNIGAVAFVSGLGQYNGTQLLSGAQQVSLVPITSTSINNTTVSTVDAINNNLASSPVSPNGGVQICFQSGGTQQSGLVTIGSSGRELSVTLAIKSSGDCS